jgi:hypothetical protein
MKGLVTAISLLLMMVAAGAQDSSNTIDLCRHIRREADGSITIAIGGATLSDHRILRDTEVLADVEYFALIDKACPASRPAENPKRRQ